MKEVVELYVIKVSKTYKPCELCGGRGYDIIPMIGNKSTKYPCSGCKGTGNFEILVESRIPLIEALLSLKSNDETD